MCSPLAQHCNDGLFACHNGLCIPKRYVCDHDDDCGDRSDEINCSTLSLQAYSRVCVLKLTDSPMVPATMSVFFLRFIAIVLCNYSLPHVQRELLHLPEWPLHSPSVAVRRRGRLRGQRRREGLRYACKKAVMNTVIYECLAARGTLERAKQPGPPVWTWFSPLSPWSNEGRQDAVPVLL